MSNLASSRGRSATTGGAGTAGLATRAAEGRPTAARLGAGLAGWAVRGDGFGASRPGRSLACRRISRSQL